MSDFKLALDNTLKLKSETMDKNLLPIPALDFINSMLNGAIRRSSINSNDAINMLTYISDLIRYFLKPDIGLWDKNTALNDYLLTRKLPE